MSRFVLEDDAPAGRFVVEDNAPAGPTAERRQGAALAQSRPVLSGALNAMQGPLMNFADEIGAYGAAGIDRFITGRNPGFTYGQLVDRYKDVARGAAEQFQKDNPLLAPALQVGAAIGTGMGGRALMQSAGAAALPTFASVINPATTLGRIGTAAAAGAGAGAISGAGQAETMADVPGEAATGAALGAVTGGAVNAIGQGLGAGARNMVGRAANNKRVQAAAEQGGGVTGPIARRIIRNADDLALDRVANALARDEYGTDRVAARLGRLGDEAALADAAGRNTRDLLDTMATMPGRTGDRVETLIRNRQVGRADRIVEGAAGLAGGRQFPQELAALTKQQADNATPIYNAIRGIPVAADDRLQRILQRPVIQDAIAQARTAAANADEVLPDIKGGEAVPMAVWDRVKRGLDDVIGLKKRGVDAGTATNAAKSTLADAVRTKRELLEVLDDLVPDYRRARNAFSGPAALKDAMEEGRGLFAMKATDLKAMLADLTESERDAFRVGAMQALRERVGTESGQTTVLKFWKEPATRERLQAIFPTARTYREFERALLAEGRLKLLEQVGRGSQTASRQARMDDEGAAFLANALDMASAARGNPLGMLSAARNLYGRVVMPEPVRDRIGGLLMTRAPEVPGLLGDLSRYVDDANARRAAAAARSGMLGGIGINSLFGGQ